MDDNTNLIESLLESATEYGKTSYELGKLKVIDKTVDVFSSFVPCTIVLSLMALFMLIFNIGLALWLGEILGKAYFGFMAVASFYGLAGILIHFFLHKWIKKLAGNFMLKKLLK
ncbi:MAG: hypothetical protein CVU00_08260 [Bacteroidetes bacterium HGW-Bacteroidetes-17]|jgi:hypothetical protein|nr:MAG: hypothetical protein CVU00_08260 [Bacteroidetes bacterium HGW-Bacteroidetes-17]